jgi:hypothetical protein
MHADAGSVNSYMYHLALNTTTACTFRRFLLCLILSLVARLSEGHFSYPLIQTVCMHDSFPKHGSIDSMTFF